MFPYWFYIGTGTGWSHKPSYSCFFVYCLHQWKMSEDTCIHLLSNVYTIRQYRKLKRLFFVPTLVDHKRQLWLILLPL
jgi:hypothetical protein